MIYETGTKKWNYVISDLYSVLLSVTWINNGLKNILLAKCVSARHELLSSIDNIQKLEHPTKTTTSSLG